MRGAALVMDDEEVLRQYLSQFLEMKGYLVLQAAEGMEALQKVDSLAPGMSVDIAVIDLTVKSGMGGRDTIRRLKAKSPGTSIIVCTGYVEPELEVSLKRIGVSDVMFKPFSLNEFGSKVDALVDYRRSDYRHMQDGGAPALEGEGLVYRDDQDN